MQIQRGRRRRRRHDRHSGRDGKARKSCRFHSISVSTWARTHARTHTRTAVFYSRRLSPLCCSNTTQLCGWVNISSTPSRFWTNVCGFCATSRCFAALEAQFAHTSAGDRSALRRRKPLLQPQEDAGLSGFAAPENRAALFRILFSIFCTEKRLQSNRATNTVSHPDAV